MLELSAETAKELTIELKEFQVNGCQIFGMTRVPS